MEPNASSIVSFPPPASPGAALANPVGMGTLGHVTSTAYSYTFPGGPDTLTFTLQREAKFRHPAMDPGRIIQVWRGLSWLWEGRLLEPVPDIDGWHLTAQGAGTYGANFDAIWSTFSADDPVNQAIARGMRWVNPGIAAGPGGSRVWLGQQYDSGSQKISDHMNMITAQGGLGWQVGRGNILTVAPLPTTVTRLLVATSPVPRTVAADINTLHLRYQATADTTSATATYGMVTATNAASIAKHGPMEEYTDLSSAGLMTAAQAQANANNVIARYQRASYSGTFAVRHGQLLTTGGSPVDLGTEQAGMVCRLILTDQGLGGEVTAGPITFTVGSYQYDDQAQVASITPMQSVASDFSSLLSAMFPASDTSSAA